jgi:O-antigen/teichoic acid export membrane protein
MRFRTAVIYSLLQQYSTFAISFVMTVIVSRLLKPEEVGVFSVAMAMTAILNSLRDMGINNYIITRKTISQENLQSAYFVALIMAFLISIIVFVSSYPLAHFFVSDELGTVLRIISFVNLFSAFGLPATALLARDLAMDKLLYSGVAAVIAQLFITVTLAYLGFSSLSLAWGQLANIFAGSAVAVYFRPETLRLMPTKKGWREVLNFGGWMTGTSIVANVSMQVPELVLGRIFGLSQAAIFSRAWGLSSIIRTTFFSALVRPALPIFSEHERAGSGSKKFYLSLIETVTGLAWPAYAFLAIWSSTIVNALYGNQWTMVAKVLPVIIVYQALVLAVTPHYDIFIVRSRLRLLFFAELAQALIMLIIVLIASTRSFEFVCGALVLHGLAFTLLFGILIGEELKINALEFARVWLKSLVPTMLCSSTAWIVGSLMGGKIHPFSAMLLSIVPTFLMAMLGFYIVKHSLKEYMIDIISSFYVKFSSKRSR